MQTEAAHDERLTRFLPVRVLIGTPPGANHPQCLIEHSFSMDWSTDRVLIFWSGKAYSILGELKLDAAKEIISQQQHYAAKHPDWKIEACDPLAEDSPVEIDWDRWLKALETGSKFDKRNAHFVLSDREILREANANYSAVQREEIAKQEA